MYRLVVANKLAGNRIYPALLFSPSIESYNERLASGDLESHSHWQNKLTIYLVVDTKQNSRLIQEDNRPRKDFMSV